MKRLVTRTRRTLCCPLLLAGSILLSAVPASAQPHASTNGDVRERAESLAKEAFQEYQRGDYDHAVRLYRRANDLAPTAALLFNIAKIYDTKIGDLKHGEEFYRQVLRSPDATPELIRQANARIEAIRALDTSRETASPSSTTADTPKPEAASTQDAPPPASATTSPPPTTSASDADPSTDDKATGGGGSGMTTAGLVLGGIGLVGLGVGGYFGLSAASKNNDAADVCPNDICSDPHGVELTDDARSAARWSTTFMVGGGVLLTSGIIFLLSGSGSSEPEKESQAIRVLPAVADRGAGLSVQGAW